MAFPFDVTVSNGVPTSGTGSIYTLNTVMAVVGTTTDAASTLTDATAVTQISIEKQISKSAQAIAAATGSTALDTGSGAGGSRTLRYYIDSAQLNTLITTAIPAGTNAIGSVSVTALPAIPTGANAIGSVSVTALPAIPAGTNAIGSVSVVNNISINSTQLGTLGPTTSAGGVPVVFVTDMAAVPVKSSSTGAAVPAGAMYEAFNAATALPTAATAGNLTGGMSDKYGRQVMLPLTVRDLIAVSSANLTGVGVTTVIASVANVYLDVTCLVLANKSTASNTAVTISDGTQSFKLFSVAGAPPVGIPFMGAPIPATNSGASWTAQATATSDVDVTIFVVKNK